MWVDKYFRRIEGVTVLPGCDECPGGRPLVASQGVMSPNDQTRDKEKGQGETLPVLNFLGGLKYERVGYECS